MVLRSLSLSMSQNFNGLNISPTDDDQTKREPMELRETPTKKQPSMHYKSIITSPASTAEPPESPGSESYTTAMVTDEPPYTCTWTNCTGTQAFRRRSDLSKHMDKHTRPYICHEPQCNRLDFSDKAGLQRHKREKHNPVQFFCRVKSCSRHLKGFARKRNMDIHIRTKHAPRHQASPIPSSSAAKTASVRSRESTEAMEETMDGDVKEEAKDDARQVESAGELSGLKGKLEELERKRKDIDEDIQTVKRTMQLMSS